MPGNPHCPKESCPLSKMRKGFQNVTFLAHPLTPTLTDT